MHPTYVASNKTVNWCIVVECTQNMCKNGSSFTWYSPVTTKRHCKYTTSVDITRCVKLRLLIHAHAPRGQRVRRSETESSAKERMKEKKKEKKKKKKKNERKKEKKTSLCIRPSCPKESLHQVSAQRVRAPDHSWR